MARTELDCYCRNQEAVITLQALVEAGFDANIVTLRGIDKLKSGGYEPKVVPGGRPIQGPDGTRYTGIMMVTALIYVTGIGRRSEDESFYLVNPDPSHLQCDLVLDPASRIARDLDENSAAPTHFRPRTDAERMKQQEEEEKKKNDEKCKAEQEKVHEQQRREREAKRAEGRPWADDPTVQLTESIDSMFAQRPLSHQVYPGRDLTDSDFIYDILVYTGDGDKILRRLVVDFRTDVNIMSDEVYQWLHMKASAYDEAQSVRLPGRGDEKPLGTVAVQWSLVGDSSIYHTRFYVVKGWHTDLVLGRPSVKELQLYRKDAGVVSRLNTSYRG
ncbi:hypothetical protein ATEIFO6365_0012008700 [Aspergillus terreus]|uniref:Uncharacterized protein n=1 Tax=Aspergillus terreus TaxID=33178 RepID=A0A5M3ZAV0_ASPTE|nr:hypothetical protein ATETN484_0013009700 [Aspergillus terreus]GFF20331.1 hypothetical protein ATEIFO6365_0012008700 [Aspergillus terreus]